MAAGGGGGGHSGAGSSGGGHSFSGGAGGGYGFSGGPGFSGRGMSGRNGLVNHGVASQPFMGSGVPGSNTGGHGYANDYYGYYGYYRPSTGIATTAIGHSLAAGSSIGKLVITAFESCLSGASVL
jgi:hypothetical protein